MQTLASQPYRSPIIVAQQAKLTILWEAYRSLVLAQEDPKTLDQRLDALWKNTEKQLQNSPNETVNELKAILDFLKEKAAS